MRTFSRALLMALVALIRGPAQAQVVTVCDSVQTRVASWIGFIEPGLDGWLFSKIDFGSSAFARPESLGWLGRFRAALAHHGVKLVIAPVPLRAEVFDDRLMPDGNPARAGWSADAARAAYRRSLELLRADGFLVADLLSVALRPENRSRQTPFFLRRDHHISPYGARAAAEEVGRLVRATPAYGALPKASFATTALADGWQRGSYGGLVADACKSPVPLEFVAQFATTRLSGPPLDLLGPAAYPVVLSGTSNSRRSWPDSHLAQFLAQSLGLDVLNVSLPAVGHFSPLEAYLSSQTYAEHKPSFLIWESGPENTFDLPDDRARRLIGGAWGPCGASSVALEGAARLPATGGVVPLLSGAARPVSGPGYYLQLDLDDLSATDFELSFAYADGAVERVRVVRSNEVQSQGRFFLELSAAYRARLEKVALTVPAGKTGAARAVICTAPIERP